MLIALLIASYTDIKKREIPIWVFPTLSVFFILLHYNTIDWVFSLISFTIVFLAFLMLAIFFKGGGGDIIMMSCLAFILGIKDISYIIIIASLLCSIYTLFNKQKTIPYAPFVLGAYMIFIGAIYGKVSDFWYVVKHYILLC